MENKFKILKDDDYNVDEMKGKWSKFLSESKILGKLQQSFRKDRYDLSIIKVNKVTKQSK